MTDAHPKLFMKKTTRDYLTISMAMLTILLCGYGLGHLMGEKKGLQNRATQDPAPQLSENWAAQTRRDLETHLQLNPEQISFAREKIRPFAATLEDDLRQLRTARTRNLLEFYDILESRLEDHQRSDLQNLRETLRSNGSF